MISRFNLAIFCVLVACMTVAKAADTAQFNNSTNTDNIKIDTTKPFETAHPMFKLGGFGTLGVSHSSQKLGDYVVDSTIPKGPGRSSDWSAGNDSRIAAHLSANFTSKISGVIQIVSEYQADGNYLPGVEWANVKYAFTPNLYFRVGRITLPTFLNSENRDVGYTYPWVHPPVDLYRVLAITNSDGFDAMYRFEIGEADNSIKFLYGKNTIDRPTSISTSRDLWGIFDTFEYGSTTLHASYQKRQASSYSLVTGVTGPWIQNSDLAVGVSYDPGDWFIKSQWIQRKSTTKLSAMYIGAGYRIAKFTPYLTYSNNGHASSLPGFPAPTAASITSANKSQSTVSLGARWDFMRNTDFKLQYDQVRLSSDSNGYLANVPTGVILYGTKFHVISATMDFVF